MSSGIDPYDHLCIFLNPDGTLTRFLTLPKKKANPIATNGEPVVSKDHTLNAEKKTHVRIYMPTIKLPLNNDTRIPIIIFYPFSNWYFPMWDTETNERITSELACQVPAIVVSVHYRLAPENRLPAQYHDGVDAILWVREQALNPNGEQWIKDYGDISRCYLYGHGSGGNIAFFSALEATRMELEPLKIVGNIMNQPLFWK
ncbi:probable carboxylesterase 9 [Quercus suber]|uniref:Carboxylesterase 9 n=1 Tax=Quercus suber TaxID=58331 RepID=A0AAW0LA69_QUESU